MVDAMVDAYSTDAQWSLICSRLRPALAKHDPRLRGYAVSTSFESSAFSNRRACSRSGSIPRGPAPSARPGRSGRADLSRDERPPAKLATWHAYSDARKVVKDVFEWTPNVERDINDVGLERDTRHCMEVHGRRRTVPRGGRHPIG